VNQDTAWIISNVLLAFIGINLFIQILGYSMGLLTSFTSAIGGMMGSTFLGSLMQGNAFSFLFVNLLRFICLVAFNGQDNESYFNGSILYFSFIIVILVAATITIPVN